MRIRIDESSYSKKFHDIIYSWDRYLIAYGGRGSGKTDSLFLKYLISLFEPYYFRLAYINKEQSNIRDQQYAGFKRVAKRIGIYDRLKFYDGDYRILNPANGNMLIPKGMDDPEKTKGLDDVTAIWWDEANKGAIEDFRALNELLRSPQAKYLQFALSFNPTIVTHWLRTTFFHPEDSHVVHPDFKGQLLLNRSTYRDNEFIDQEQYLETLIKSAAGNANTLRVNVDGDWGLEENGNPWLHAFDENKHVRKDLPFLPSFPVYLSFDFNVEPMSCIAAQMSPNRGHKDSFVHIIREFSGFMTLKDLCAQIKTAFPNSILFVTGDRSGNNRDAGFQNKNDSYYTMIRSYLGLTEKQMQQLTFNMEHSDSWNLCNTMLYNLPNVHIDASCKLLIEDCRKATIDEKKSKPYALKKDRGDYKLDLFDGFRYLWQRYFSDFIDKVKFLR